MGRRRQPFRHLTRLPLSAIVPPEGEPPPADTVERLAAQLHRQGQREPVLVTPLAGKVARSGAPGYRLVVGRRRLAAARQLRWSELDAVVLGPEFAAELALIEQLRTAPPLELAAALQRLQQRCGWTQAQLGTVVGRNRDFVAGLLALNDIRPDVQAWLAAHAGRRPLSARHLRYIGRATPRRQLAVAQEIVAQGLSAKALEQRFRQGPRRRQYIKVRSLRQPTRDGGPETAQQWRRYYRKLRTDLRRVDEQEAQELRRTREQIDQARQRERLIRHEARAKRDALNRELRRATRRLSRTGALE